MSFSNPSINFVSRTSLNGGVIETVDVIEGLSPFPAGAVTLAFGGSVGSCFVQNAPFYTSQNIGVIQFRKEISREAKLFFAVVLEKIYKNKYVAFAGQ